MSELKKTDIGHIPSDWDCVLFNEVAELRHGHQFRNYDFTTDGLKVVKITQIKGDGTMNLSSCSFIDSNRLEEFKVVPLLSQEIYLGYLFCSSSPSRQIRLNIIVCH